MGSRRIGIAVTDPFGTYALPVGTYERKNLKTDVAYFAALANERGAGEIVCGLPLNFDGTRSAQTEYTEVFISALRAALLFPSDLICMYTFMGFSFLHGHVRKQFRLDHNLHAAG